ncbi:ABC transporter substrate-binding protein, partial [Rhodococcus aerolatus]
AGGPAHGRPQPALAPGRTAQRQARPLTPVRTRGLRAVVAGVLLAVLAAACAPLPGGEPADDAGPFLGVAVPGRLTSYNTATTDAVARGDARAALARVLPGFSVTGPQGVPVADTDVGVATLLSTDPLSVRYTLTPAARWSDGAPLVCEDLVLAWAAHSGRYGAGAADPSGWSDVEAVDCAAGERTATVRFTRPYQQWQTLFGPGDLLPAHVAATRTGVTDVVGAVTRGDTAALTMLVDFWRTGWTLPTGPVGPDGEVTVDPALFPAAGPYRLDSVAPDGTTATLVGNDAWWGDPPLVPRVEVHLSPTDPQTLLGTDAVQALAVPAGPTTRDAVAAATSPAGTLRVAGGLSLERESLVLDTRGVLGRGEARRALAACVPRQDVLDELVSPVAPGAALLDSHALLPGTLGYDATTAPARPFDAVDPTAARAAVDAAGLGGATVRIGYRGPDERLARTVALVARSCGAAGLTVVDVGGPDVTPEALAAGTADAVVVDTGGTALPGSGTAGLRTGAPTNWGGYTNPRVDTLLDQVATAPTLGEQLPALTELETVLWTDLPTLPLHQVPTVTAALDRLPSVVANPSAAGVAWNVDRWALTP